MTEETTIPSQWTHHTKLDGTAKGYRLSVSVYANSQKDAVFEVVETLKQLEAECEARGVAVAPLEVSKK